MRSLPILLQFSGRLAVVVGGGRVGRRKVDTLITSGAAVRVVDCSDRPDDVDPSVEWVAAPYRADHLAGASLVVAAGPADVNAAVVADARAAGLWVCDAADPDRGDFTFPSTARVGGLTISVGTGGASPGLARRLTEKFAADLDPAYGAWVGLLAAVRPFARETIADPAVRRRVLDDLADDSWRTRLLADGPDAVLAAMRAAVRRAGG